MDITKAVNKLHTDYHNADNIVNRSIKYSFHYHNSYTSVYYIKTNDLGRCIILVVSVNSFCYLMSIPFNESHNLYYITPYIPEEIYPLLYPFIFKKDHNSPVQYFEKIIETVLNTQPITTNYVTDINRKDLYTYKNNFDCPFFQNFVRANMSYKMKNKIRKQFGSDLATQIINYCRNMGKTCRFTSDITKAHDIVLAMNNIQEII